MRHDVVVVGSINVDLVLTVARHPHPGETLLGGSGALSAGGKGANQAVAAARQGASVAMVGAVGTDANASTALHELSAAGVDLTSVATLAGATGLAIVTIAEDGENTIIVVPGANAGVTPEMIDRSAAVIGSGTVAVLQAEIPLASVERAVTICAAAERRVVLNLAPACTLPLETLRHADPLVLNEHELAVVLASLELTPKTGRLREDQTLPTALASAQRLREIGARSVIVTLGRMGVVGAGPEGQWSEPARVVTARDTTGAGDAFVGALASRLARGKSLHDAAALAARVAAYSVQRLGAQVSYPWKDDPLP